MKNIIILVLLATLGAVVYKPTLAVSLNEQAVNVVNMGTAYVNKTAEPTTP